MDTLPVDTGDYEKRIQDDLDSLARIIIKLYQQEHPLPDSTGTLPLYNGKPIGSPD